MYVAIFGVYADPRFFPNFSILPCAVLRSVSCLCCALRFVLLFGVLKGISQVSRVVVLNL